MHRLRRPASSPRSRSQTFHNPGSVQIESEFLPLPEDGAVQTVLLVDGRELPGRLMNKDEARRIYEEIVRTKRDPAAESWAADCSRRVFFRSPRHCSAR